MKTKHEKLMQAKMLNQLNAEETIQFDELYAGDEKFRKEYELLNQMIADFKGGETGKLRSKLDAIYEKTYSTKKEVKMIHLLKQNWYSVAAAVVVLLMVGAYWFNSSNQKDWSTTVFENYYHQDEVYVNTRGEANFDVDVLHTGMQLLENKEFLAALNEFNKLPNSVTANYYSGVANMELNRTDLAIIKFDYVINDYLNLFYDQAQWYKGLCLVKLQKKDEAIRLFTQITKTDSYFKLKAEQIVADLKKD
jgi:tetratricopeptide (TPR) repeat protein